MHPIIAHSITCSMVSSRQLISVSNPARAASPRQHRHRDAQCVTGLVVGQPWEGGQQCPAERDPLDHVAQQKPAARVRFHLLADGRQQPRASRRCG